jgi:hypothetical protein
MEAQRQLQKQIVARERSLGMRTVLPAFAGHVPLALPAKYPGTKMGNNPCWGASGFTGKRWSCDGLLDAADPKFSQIAEAFMLAQKEEYGSDGIYNGDTFNEMAASGNITEWELVSSLRWQKLMLMRPGLSKVQKTHLLRHFVLKMIILPRQARNKDRGNSKKRCVFRRVEPQRLANGQA